MHTAHIMYMYMRPYTTNQSQCYCSYMYMYQGIFTTCTYRRGGGESLPPHFQTRPSYCNKIRNPRQFPYFGCLHAHVHVRVRSFPLNNFWKNSWLKYVPNTRVHTVQPLNGCFNKLEVSSQSSLWDVTPNTPRLSTYMYMYTISLLVNTARHSEHGSLYIHCL